MPFYYEKAFQIGKEAIGGLGDNYLISF